MLVLLKEIGSDLYYRWLKAFIKISDFLGAMDSLLNKALILCTTIAHSWSERGA